jgi:hypothetical protein
VASDCDIAIRYAKSSKHGTTLRNVMASSSKPPIMAPEEDDLEFVLQLSLAEEQSKISVGNMWRSLGRAAYRLLFVESYRFSWLKTAEPRQVEYISAGQGHSETR